MKIKINNETDYDTSYLRKIFNRCKRMVDRRMKGLKTHEDAYGKKYNSFYPIKQLRVDVVYKKSYSNWTGGYAYYNSNYVRMKLIRPPEAMKFQEPEKIYDRTMLTEMEWLQKIENGKKWNQERKERRELQMKEISKNIALTMVHELYHCYGYTHEDNVMFAPRKKVWVENTYNYDWTSKYPVQFTTEKPKTEKPKTDIQVKRYLRVVDLLKAKQMVFKRLSNQIKKYASKKRYYENILMAAGKLPDKK